MATVLLLCCGPCARVFCRSLKDWGKGHGITAYSVVMCYSLEIAEEGKMAGWTVHWPVGVDLSLISYQARRPAEFKHIIKRRKRN